MGGKLGYKMGRHKKDKNQDNDQDQVNDQDQEKKQEFDVLRYGVYHDGVMYQAFEPILLPEDFKRVAANGIIMDSDQKLLFLQNKKWEGVNTK